MRKFISLTLVALIAALVASCSGGASFQALPGGGRSASAPAPSPSQPATPAAGRYIVILKDSVGDVPSAAKSVSATFGVAPERTYTYAMKGFAATLSSQAAVAIAKDPRVSEVQPDKVYHIADWPDDAKTVSAQPAQTVPWGVARIGATLNTGHRGSGVTVAIVDTGIFYTHPDLAANYKGGYNAVEPYKTPLDDHGHGTHCSGIVAALDNSIGVVGVAPRAGLVAVKVLNYQGYGYDSWIVSGIDWIIANKRAYGGIKVANMSFGGFGTDDAMHIAVSNLYNAGVTIAAAAGNSHVDASTFVPASYPEVICVSALSPDGTFAWYSDYGSVINVIAPGTSVPSTYLNNGYAVLSGTSMASPHTAGCAALWVSDHLTATPSQVKAALIATGEPGPSGGWSGDPDGITEPLVNARNL